MAANNFILIEEGAYLLGLSEAAMTGGLQDISAPVNKPQPAFQAGPAQRLRIGG
jgi:hypothetical protein